MKSPYAEEPRAGVGVVVVGVVVVVVATTALIIRWTCCHGVLLR